MSKCEHGLTSAECFVCASPKYGKHDNKRVSDVCKEVELHGIAHPAPPAFDVEEAMRLADVYASCTWASSDTTKDARAALYSYLKGEKK